MQECSLRRSQSAVSSVVIINRPATVFRVVRKVVMVAVVVVVEAEAAARDVVVVVVVGMV